jgi:hypothetical protein
MSRYGYGLDGRGIGVQFSAGGRDFYTLLSDKFYGSDSYPMGKGKVVLVLN